MATTVTISLPPKLRDEMSDFAKRHERTVSWVVRKCWELGREQLEQTQTPPPKGSP